jgi:hypothetical protein
MRADKFMISALPKLVAAMHPRPAHLTNEGCCYSDDHLAEILAKSDGDMNWADFQTLLTISRCTGKYEELVYFVPICIQYCDRKSDGVIDCLSSLIYFLSREFDRLREDSLAELIAEALRELFDRWIAEFHVTHFDAAACAAKVWGLTHSDIVDRLHVIDAFVEDALRYKTYAGLAEELIGSLAEPPAGGARSAWLLAYAYECRVRHARWLQTRDEVRARMREMHGGVREHDDTPPWSLSATIVRLINDTELLRRHMTAIEATSIVIDGPPTYWNAVRGLLDFPPSADPATNVNIPIFTVADAKPYVPEEPQPQTPTPPGQLLSKFQAGRDQLLASIEKLAERAGMTENEPLMHLAAQFVGLGRQFRGHVPGFEQELRFRFLIISGNYVLCENEQGPLRIPFKDFVAACESGRLAEVPDEPKQS